MAYQSALPPDEEGEEAGFVGYYTETATRNIYVFSELIFDDSDVSAALIELGWQFDTDSDAFHPRDLVEPWPLGVQSVNEPRTTGVWLPASTAEVFAVMGFTEEAQSADPTPLQVSEGGVAGNCKSDITHAVGDTLDRRGRLLMPAPSPVPNDSLTGVLLVVNCGGGGGGGTPSCSCCAVLDGPGGVAAGLNCCTGGCDDGNPCTTDDVCVGVGDCQGTPKNCRVSEPCKFGFCENGTCKVQNLADGRLCPDDGDSCTLNECQGGVCTHPPKCTGGQGCCNGCCDPVSESCCNGACCSGGSCCASADECCSSVASGCCPLPSQCCTDGCCECCDSTNGGACCTNDCCGIGNACCPDALSMCCGGNTCCDPAHCCGNGECCAETCEGCYDNGFLFGGTVDVVPATVCVGDTITFTASGVQDNGGTERVMCSAKQPIPSGGVTYDWTLTLPAGYPPPLPALSGSGATVGVTAKVPGPYAVSFTANPTRTQCPPASIGLPTGTGNAIGLEFAENAGQAYGFDDYTNRNNNPVVPFKSVEVVGSDVARLVVQPSGAPGTLYLTSTTPTNVTVSPISTTVTTQNVTASGVAAGESTVNARLNSPSAVSCSAMQVAAYNPGVPRVAITLVNEQNDDVQTIPFGQGSPDQHSIRSGPNGVIDALLAGDDRIVSDAGEQIVLTGFDGISDTTAAGDDIQIIPVGNGAPSFLCVGLGGNGFRDTGNVDARDVLVNDGIGTGADGICHSIAVDTDVLSTDFGTGATIKAFLDDVYRQAVTSWPRVRKRQPISVNFDLNRDGLLDVGNGSLEMQAVFAARDPDFAFNVFFVDSPNDASLLGWAIGADAAVFIAQHTSGNVNNTIAHELGHTLGLPHPDEMGDPDADNLMHTVNGNTKLRKGQWDTIQGAVPHN